MLWLKQQNKLSNYFRLRDKIGMDGAWFDSGNNSFIAQPEAWLALTTNAS
jgi:hypothetical protein